MFTMGRISARDGAHPVHRGRYGTRSGGRGLARDGPERRTGHRGGRRLDGHLHGSAVGAGEAGRGVAGREPPAHRAGGALVRGAGGVLVRRSHPGEEHDGGGEGDEEAHGPFW
jgi:hypothetical protein